MTMLERQKYRKKPVVIEAIRYSGDNLAEVLAFTGRHPRFYEWFSSFDEYAAHVASDRQVFKILTLEGTMEASPGDWVIKGVKGEFYPCKPDIFDATYEPVFSTITPAEVGGLVDAQTEARAIAQRLMLPDEDVFELAVDIIATALAAKDAELAAVKENCETVCNSYADENQRLYDRAERAEAQLAEANKALEPFANVAEHDIGEDEDDSDTFWPMSNARYSMAGRLRVGHLRAARRAREQGGENG